MAIKIIEENEQDPAFENYNKPIGPFLTREEAQRRRDEWGWKVREDSQRRGWRRWVYGPVDGPEHPGG